MNQDDRRAGVRHAVETFLARRRRGVTNGGLHSGRFRHWKVGRDEDQSLPLLDGETTDDTERTTTVHTKE